MICSKCGGKWKVKRVPWPFGPRRQVCEKCGYIDQRKSWVNGEYTGPPGEETFEERLQIKFNKLFYEKKKMPCCGKDRLFYEGPSGGISINIKCAHCGQRWNISPLVRVIEKI